MEPGLRHPRTPSTSATGSTSPSSPREHAIAQLREWLRLRAEFHTRSDPRLPSHAPGGGLPTPEPIAMPCPPSMRRATYRRLIRLHERLRVRLAQLPQRGLPSLQRKRLTTQFRNRLRRIRRRLGLPEREPRRRTWYRPALAAEFLRVSPRMVLRWEAAGLLPSGRTPGGHRRFHHRDLLRLRGTRRP